MGKVLVAYFSASGVTACVAREIARATGGDLFEITPAEPYTAADLDWTDKQSRSTREMNDTASRPALAARMDDMGSYDTVFVGFPIWWGVEPRAVDTFFDSYDFTGKTMIAFATSGGSGMAAADRSVRAHCPAGAWRPGKLLNGGDIAKWARSQVA